MTTCSGKSCSFGLPQVPFINCCQFMYLVISLLVLRAGCGIWLYQFLIIADLFTLSVCHYWTNVEYNNEEGYYSLHRNTHNGTNDSADSVMTWAGSSLWGQTACSLVWIKRLFTACGFMAYHLLLFLLVPEEDCDLWTSDTSEIYTFFSSVDVKCL